MKTKILLILATLVALAGAGVGGAAIAGAFDGDDERTLSVSVGNTAQPASGDTQLTVEDGIARDRAIALARAATGRVPGRALTVEAEDGGYEVDVRDRDGRIVEVLLDGRSRVTGIDETD
jgi:hypothetical protein